MQAAEFLFSPQNETVLVCSVSSVFRRMRMKIYSWLLVFILGCNVSAEKKEKIIRQKDSITLPCPHPVEGKVTWSRETNGNRVDILTVDGDRDIRHIHDPLKRYSSSADKSLHISRVAVSDAGTYFCNNEAAVELTVITGHKEPTTTTTTSSPPSPPTARKTTVDGHRRLLHGVSFGIGTVLLVLLLLLIVVFTRRYRSKRRGCISGCSPILAQRSPDPADYMTFNVGRSLGCSDYTTCQLVSGVSPSFPLRDLSVTGGHTVRY